MSEQNYFSMALSHSLDQKKEAMLTFQVDTSDIALKWFGALKTEIEKKTAIKEPNRVYNFANKESGLESCVFHLKECVGLINTQYSNLIEKEIDKNLSFADLNHLHLYFEKLRGSIENPSDYFIKADQKLKNAIEKFNIEIHRYEDFIRSSDAQAPRVVCTFLDRPRFDLQDSELDEFSLQRKYGDVFINYCEVGKTILEVYQARDSSVSDENIRPQNKYSADFNVYLGGNTIDKTEALAQKEEVKKWILENKINLKIESQKMAIGKIHVANLVSSKFFSDLSTFDCIQRITL